MSIEYDDPELDAAKWLWLATKDWDDEHPAASTEQLLQASQVAATIYLGQRLEMMDDGLHPPED